MSPCWTKFIFSLNYLAFYLWCSLSGFKYFVSSFGFHFLGFILISMTRASALLKLNFPASLSKMLRLVSIWGVCDGADGEEQFLTSWVDSHQTLITPMVPMVKGNFW